MNECLVQALSLGNKCIGLAQCMMYCTNQKQQIAMSTTTLIGKNDEIVCVAWINELALQPANKDIFLEQ